MPKNESPDFPQLISDILEVCTVDAVAINCDIGAHTVRRLATGETKVVDYPIGLKLIQFHNKMVKK